MKTLKLPAYIDRLAQVASMVVEFAFECGMSPPRVTEIELAVDEAFTNVCRHAYGAGDGQVIVRCFNDGGGRIVVELTDEGIPFDPFSLPEPDLSATLEEREVGGLGVFLIRKMADHVEYERSGNRNVLRLYFSEKG